MLPNGPTIFLTCPGMVLDKSLIYSRTVMKTYNLSYFGRKNSASIFFSSASLNELGSPRACWNDSCNSDIYFLNFDRCSYLALDRCWLITKELFLSSSLQTVSDRTSLILEKDPAVCSPHLSPLSSGTWITSESFALYIPNFWNS